MKKLFNLRLLMLFMAAAVLFGCKKDDDEEAAPIAVGTDIVFKNDQATVDGTSATFAGGLTTLADRVNVTEHGHVWGTAPNPMLEGALGSSTLGSLSAAGDFTSSASGLTEGTTYYVRSYVTANGETFYNPNSTMFEVASAAAPPTANFTYSPEPAQANEPVTFNNLSENAVSYEWDFGDGNTSTEENPTHTYTEGGSFRVTLVATNAAGETAQIRKAVRVEQKVLTAILQFLVVNELPFTEEKTEFGAITFIFDNPDFESFDEAVWSPMFFYTLEEADLPGAGIPYEIVDEGLEPLRWTNFEQPLYIFFGDYNADEGSVSTLAIEELDLSLYSDNRQEEIIFETNDLGVQIGVVVAWEEE